MLGLAYVLFLVIGFVGVWFFAVPKLWPAITPQVRRAAASHAQAVKIAALEHEVELVALGDDPQHCVRCSWEAERQARAAEIVAYHEGRERARETAKRIQAEMQEAARKRTQAAMVKIGNANAVDLRKLRELDQDVTR